MVEGALTVKKVMIEKLNGHEMRMQKCFLRVAVIHSKILLTKNIPLSYGILKSIGRDTNDIKINAY